MDLSKYSGAVNTLILYKKHLARHARWTGLLLWSFLGMFYVHNLPLRKEKLEMVTFYTLMNVCDSKSHLLLFYTFFSQLSKRSNKICFCKTKCSSRNPQKCQLIVKDPQGSLKT